MLRLTDLRKSFGPIEAVRGVSLELKPGELFGLLGPNGAGKSTTIAMACGLLLPDQGRVELIGVGEPADPRTRASIGIAPQALALYEELTGLENVRFFGRLYNLEGKALTDRARELLNLVGLDDRRMHRAKTYSGGMKRRLNLACALVHDPPLLLLDEPTAGVDPQSRHAIFDVLTGLRSRGKTILYTTHYMEEAEKLCDRVAIVDHGRVLAIDTVPELVRAHGGRSVVSIEREDGVQRIETDDPPAELARLLAAGPVRGVRIDSADLEAVFLNLTGRSLRD